MFAQGDELYFNLYFAEQSRSEWLGINETYDENFVIKSYDENNQQLTVEYKGNSLT